MKNKIMIGKLLKIVFLCYNHLYNTVYVSFVLLQGMCFQVTFVLRSLQCSSFCTLLTGFHPKSLKTITCITTETPTGQYYCDLITPTIGVASGGNGGGAMVADEIGRTAAKMILKGAWDSDLPQDEFRVRWRTREGATKSQL